MNLKAYVDTCNKIKELTEAKKNMEIEMVKAWFEEEKLDGNKIKKIVSNRVYLKKWYDVTTITSMFPECIKTEVDMDVLKATPAAADCLELRPSTSFRIFKLKDDWTDEDDF